MAFSGRLRLHDISRRGDFSYGTYLYGFPIQQIVMALWGASLPFALYVPATMLLALMAGVLSWHLVEQWFLPRSRRQRDVALSPVPAPEMGLDGTARLQAP